MRSPNRFRLTANRLFETLENWDSLLKFCVHLIGCGGLAHQDDPYFIYQLWRGKRVFTTELLDSPLETGKHIMIREYRRIYLGALNLVDLIITKMFRGTRADMEDCVAAF